MNDDVVRSVRPVRSSSQFVAAAIFTLLLAWPLAAGITPAGAGQAERKELVSLRTGTSSTFRNGDGTYSTVLHSNRIHYRDEGGRWRKIDSAIVPADEQGYALVNRANGFRTRFKKRLEKEFAQVEVGESPYSLSLGGGARVDAEVDGSRVTYGDVLPSTDLVYEVSANALKETLVLENARAPSRFRFTIRGRLGDHLVLSELPDGSWRIRHREEPGSTIVLRAPFATDRADGTPLAKPHASLQLEPDGNRIHAVLAVDRRWLRAPGRRFPVRVDPTIELASGTLDASFKANCPTCIPDTGANLLIGTTATDTWRAALRFNLADLPPGAQITSANLKLFDTAWCIRPDGSCGGAHELDVHRLTRPFSHASTSSEIGYEDERSATYTLPVNSEPEWMSWNVTGVVTSWQHDLLPNHGLLVKRATEPVDASGPNPHSSRWHEPSLRPRLEVTYTTESVELLPPPTLHSNGADLAWTRYTPLSGTPFEKYEVHRSRDAGFTPSRATLLTTVTNIDTTTYRDTSAAPAKTFAYKMVVNGVPSNERTVTLPPHGQARKVLQPGPSEGKATYLYFNSGYTDCNVQGASNVLWLGPGTNDIRRVLLQFALGDIPSGSSIESATLSLYRGWGMWFTPPALHAHRLTASWEEGVNGGCNGSGATWYERQGGIPWAAAGGDYDAALAASTTIPNPAPAGWDSFQLAGLVQQWIDGTAANHGLLLRLADEAMGSNGYWYYHSDDSPTSSLRPTLAVNYSDGSDAIEPTVAISEPLGGGVKGTVTVGVAASDDRRVETVEFFVDGKQIAADQAPPFTTAWDTKRVANGTHSLTAKAIDDAGNATTSNPPVVVTVGNSAPPQTDVRVLGGPAYSAAVQADLPVGHWRLGDAAGSPTALDSGPNGYHGMYGSRVYPGQPGALAGDTDTAARFDGISFDGQENDEVTIADRDALDFGTGDFTVEAWIKTATTGGEETVLAKRSDASGQRWRVTVTNDAGFEGRLRADLKGGGASLDYYGPNIRVDDDRWHHVVAVYERNWGARVYVDGHLQATPGIVSGSVSNDAALQIGGDSSNDPTYRGRIDEAALYPRALSHERVLAHYRAGRAGVWNPYREQVLSSSPDSYLRLGEVPGFAYARDSSGNALKGVYEPRVDTGAPGALANDANTAAYLANDNLPSIEEEVELIDHPLLDFGTRDFSAEAWVKTGFNEERTIVSKCCRDGHPYWRVSVTDDSGYVGRARAKIFEGNVTRTVYGPNIRIDDNAWHHVAAVFDRSWGIKIYVDGIESATMGPTPGSVSNPADFEIGDADGEVPFKGTLDEVAVYPRVVAAERILGHYNARMETGYDRVVLADEPRGYWRLDEPVEWTKARDESPNNREALYQAAEAGVDGIFASGDSNTAARFGGWSGESFIDFGDRYDFAGTAPFSVEAWIKPTGDAGLPRIVSKEDAVGANRTGWTLYINDHASEPDRYWIGFERYPNAPQGDGIGTFSTFQFYEPRVWKHVVATYDGSTMAIYVDGKQAAIGLNRTQPIPDNPRPFHIGGSDWTDADYWKGDLDEVAVYTRALTPEEVLEHFDTAQGPGKALSGLVTLQANASDDVAVTKVEFLVDGVKVAEDAVPPTFEASWDTLDAAKPAYDGVHQLTTKAYDAHDHVTTSTPLRVEVANTGGTPHRATYASTTVPDSVAGDVAVDVKVTNTSKHTWNAGQMAIAYRWVDPVNPTIVAEGTPVTIPGPVAPDESRDLTLTVTPPPLPPGVSRAQYRLRFDIYDSTAAKWLERAGNRPLERLATVLRTLPVGLGLERYYQYEGEELGAGMQHLLNVASGNSLVRWTPFEAPGRGLSTVVDLTYNSLDGTIESPLGKAWSLSLSTLNRLGTPLAIYPDRVELVDGDGTLHRFERSPPGSATTKEPPGVHLYLRQTGSPDPDKTWAATRPDRVTFYFDAEGNPTSVEDRNGNQLRFTLEPVPPAEQHGTATERVTAVTDAAGVSNPALPNRSFGLDYYSPAESPHGAVWGRLQRLTDHSGSALDFEYLDNGSLQRIIQRGGTNADGSPLADRSFVLAYDGGGRLDRVTDPRSNPTVLAYEQVSGRLQTRTNRENEQTSFAYDVPARTTSVTKPLSRVTTYGYDADGKPVKITNPKGETARLIWSRDRHVTKVIEPTGVFVEYAHDDNGYLTDQVDELGNHTKFEYEYIPVDENDVAGKWADGRSQPHISQLVRKTDPKGNVTQSPPDDYQWRFAYDERGNLLKTTDPLGSSEESVYHSDGTVSAEIDANRHKTTFGGYDGNGLPTVVVEPTGATTRLAYDADGLLRSLQDPNHAKYRPGDFANTRHVRSEFDYDSFHRLGRASTPKSTELGLEQPPAKLIWTAADYDANDNVTAEIGPREAESWSAGFGPRTDRSYDPMDRAIQVTGPDRRNGDEVTKLGYDAAGRLSLVTPPKGDATPSTPKDFATEYEYDLLDRVVKETAYPETARVTDEAVWRMTRYCYDLAGDLRSVTAPRSTDFTACPANSPPATYTYTTATNTTKLEYDAAHRLIKETNPLGHSTTATYDANGDAIAETDEQGSKTVTSYNERGELVLVAKPFTQTTAGKVTRALTTKLEYDPAGNLVREISPRGWDAAGTREEGFPFYVTSHEYDGSDRLVRTQLPDDTATADAWVHRRYDANGNVAWTSMPVGTPDPALVPETRKTLIEYWDGGEVRSTDDPGASRKLFFDTVYRGDGALRCRRVDAPPDCLLASTPQQTTWDYDADNLLRDVTDRGQLRSTYGYDAHDLLTSANEARTTTRPAIEIAASYTGFDEPKEEKLRELPGGQPANWNVTVYEDYDLNGNEKRRRDGSIETSGGATVAAGRLHRFHYDADDRVTKEVNDNATASDCTDDWITEPAYVPTDWQSERKLSRGTGACLQASNPNAGEPSGATLKTTATWSYFADGSTKTTTTWRGAAETGTLLEAHALSYTNDAGHFLNGHRTRDEFLVKAPAGANPAPRCADETQAGSRIACTLKFSYDARERLTKEELADNKLEAGQSANLRTTDYTLDLAGNVTSEHLVEGATDRTRTYVYDAERLIRRETGGSTDRRYFYDAEQNVACVTSGAWAGSVCPAATDASLLERYSYDYRNRATRISRHGGGAEQAALELTYDALSRPYEEKAFAGTQLGQRRELHYVGLTGLLDREDHFASEGPSQPVRSRSYRYDLFGGRVGLTDDPESGPAKDFSYGHDAKGSVSLLLDDLDQIQAGYGYRPYGEADTSLTRLAPSFSDPNAYRFDGKRLDGDSGTLDMGARRFSPDPGRFLQRDEYEDALADLDLAFDALTQNRYSFAGGNPLSFVEMDGHDPNFYDYNRRSKQKKRLQRRDREYSAAPDSRPVSFRPETERRSSVAERRSSSRSMNERRPKVGDACPGGLIGRDGRCHKVETPCAGFWGAIDCSPAAGPVRAARVATRVPPAISRVGRWVGIGSASKGATRSKELVHQTFPPNEGFFMGWRKPEVLQPGTRFDRYGSEGGRFFSPVGTPFAKRGLPPSARGARYGRYEVIRELPVEGGLVAPVFGPGLGNQYRSNASVRELVRRGYVRRVP